MAIRVSPNHLQQPCLSEYGERFRLAASAINFFHALLRQSIWLKQPPHPGNEVVWFGWFLSITRSI